MGAAVGGPQIWSHAYRTAVIGPRATRAPEMSAAADSQTIGRRENIRASTA